MMQNTRKVVIRNIFMEMKSRSMRPKLIFLNLKSIRPNKLIERIRTESRTVRGRRRVTLDTSWGRDKRSIFGKPSYQTINYYL